jgi:hypothetical protein
MIVVLEWFNGGHSHPVRNHLDYPSSLDVNYLASAALLDIPNLDAMPIQWMPTRCHRSASAAVRTRWWTSTFAQYGQDERELVTGRSSWLFSDTVAGAKASAMIYSRMVTRRACNVEPYAYLVNVLIESPQRAPDADISDLLPLNLEKHKRLVQGLSCKMPLVSRPATTGSSSHVQGDPPRCHHRAGPQQGQSVTGTEGI